MTQWPVYFLPNNNLHNCMNSLVQYCKQKIQLSCTVHLTQFFEKYCNSGMTLSTMIELVLFRPSTEWRISWYILVRGESRETFE